MVTRTPYNSEDWHITKFEILPGRIWFRGERYTPVESVRYKEMTEFLRMNFGEFWMTDSEVWTIYQDKYRSSARTLVESQ